MSAFSSHPDHSLPVGLFKDDDDNDDDYDDAGLSTVLTFTLQSPGTIYCDDSL
jgi:hypothetical protein